MAMGMRGQPSQGSFVPQYYVAPPRYIQPPVGAGGGFYGNTVAQRSWLPPPAGLANLLPGLADFKFHPEPRPCGATAFPTTQLSHAMFQAKRVSMQPLATEQSTAPVRVTPGLQQVSNQMGTMCHQGGFSGNPIARSWLPPGIPPVPQRSWVPPPGGLADLLLGPAHFPFYPGPRPCGATIFPETQPSNDSFQAKPGSKQPLATLEEHTALAQNKECADCGAPAPEWASVNQGVLICIECAGCHRSMGAHISKVKSVTLDSWKPDEIQSFTSKGGNQKVNNDLLRSGGPPPPARGAPRAAIDNYIRKKYGGEKAADEKSTAPLKVGKTPGLQEDNLMGTTCHQGLVMVDIDSVDIGVERARDLRMLGPFFLSLKVQLSLGSQTSEPTSSRWGSENRSRMDSTRKKANAVGCAGALPLVSSLGRQLRLQATCGRRTH
eukprot:s3116_g11.t1